MNSLVQCNHMTTDTVMSLYCLQACLPLGHLRPVLLQRAVGFDLCTPAHLLLHCLRTTADVPTGQGRPHERLREF